MLADGRGGTATAVVTAVGRGSLELTVIARGYVRRRPVPRLVVVQGIAKGDRGELAVQAMTEVGVDGIVPWAAVALGGPVAGERGERARADAGSTPPGRRPSRPAGPGCPWWPWPDESTSDGAPPAGRRRRRLRAARGGADRLTTWTCPSRRRDRAAWSGPRAGSPPTSSSPSAPPARRPVRLGPTVLRTSTAGAGGAGRALRPPRPLVMPSPADGQVVRWPIRATVRRLSPWKRRSSPVSPARVPGRHRAAVRVARGRCA